MKSTGVGQNRQYPSTYMQPTPTDMRQDINIPVKNTNSNADNNYREYNRQPQSQQQQQQLNLGKPPYNRQQYNKQQYNNADNRSRHNMFKTQNYRENAAINQNYKNYQPRQIQKTADLESEYNRLHKQDELTHYVEDPTNILSLTNMATLAENEQTNVKSELPVLTLKNSLSKISFCDRECFNVNDNVTKEAILKYIETKYKGLNIIDNQYVMMKPHMLKNITYHEHILTTFTNGNPYLLVLTRIDNVPCSIFIDRKVKDGYCYPKIHCVQYKFDSILFDTETIFTGELVRDINRNFQYLISDLLVYNGEYIKHRNILSRFQTLHTLLDTQYTPDITVEICPLYCKRLFQYADIKFVLHEFLPTLSYTCKGLIFHTLNNQFSDYAWVMPREKQIDVKRQHDIDTEFYTRFPEFAQYRSADINQLTYLTNHNSKPNNQSVDSQLVTNQEVNDYRRPSVSIHHSNYPDPDSVVISDIYTSDKKSTMQFELSKNRQFVGADAMSSNPFNTMLGNSNYYVKLLDPVILLAMQTEIPDIINLYTQDNLTDKLGYAFIPNLRVSQMLYHAFKQLPTGQITIYVSVAFHRVFNRWVPFEIVSNPILVDTTATLESKKLSNKLTDIVTATNSENVTAIGLIN